MQANARIGFMRAKKRKQTAEKENMDSAEQNHKTFSPLGMILTYAKKQQNRVILNNFCLFVKQPCLYLTTRFNAAKADLPQKQFVIKNPSMSALCKIAVNIPNTPRPRAKFR